MTPPSVARFDPMYRNDAVMALMIFWTIGGQNMMSNFLEHFILETGAPPTAAQAPEPRADCPGAGLAINSPCEWEITVEPPPGSGAGSERAARAGVMPVHWDSALLSAFWGSMVVSRLVSRI